MYTVSAYSHFWICLVSNLQKWKISCFRHEEISPENSKSDYVEHFLPEELVQPELDKSSARKRDWKSTLQEVMIL